MAGFLYVAQRSSSSRTSIKTQAARSHSVIQLWVRSYLVDSVQYEDVILHRARVCDCDGRFRSARGGPQFLDCRHNIHSLNNFTFESVK